MAFVHQSPAPARPAMAPPHAPDCTCDAHRHEAGATRRIGVLPAWLGPVIVAGAGVAACAYTALNDPNTSSGIFPQCTFKSLTGLDCPGCGMTRGVYALLQGDPIKMLNHNLVLLLLLPVVLYGYTRWLLSTLGYDRLPRITLRGWQGYSMLAFVLAFWVVRNIPGPLSWLDAVA